MDRKEDREWRELMERKEDFQHIVRLLTTFDEKTGRFQRYGEPATHYMRRALAESSTDDLHVFLRHTGGFVYSIVAECRTVAGLVSTLWVHEDGIRAEREELAGEPGHPVHTIVCMTDLYENHSRKREEGQEDFDLNHATRDFLLGEACVGEQGF